MRKLLLLLLVSVALTGTVQGLDSDEGDGSDVNVTIASVCDISTQEYIMPNGGVIGRGKTGSFYAEFQNRGSLNATIRVPEFNISYYNRSSGDTEYLNLTVQQTLDDDYEPLYDYTNFTETVDLIGPSSFAEWIKSFTAIDRYEFREYNATLTVNATCNSTLTDRQYFEYFNITKDFAIINSTGGVSEFGDRVTNQTFPANTSEFGQEQTPNTVKANVSRFGNQTPTPTDAEVLGGTANDTIPREANRTGGGTNLTIPLDANRTGGRSNQTVTRDANRTGGRANLSVRGRSSDRPGSFPRPIIEMEPVNRTYTVKRGQSSPVGLRIRNLGNISVSDIIISPRLGKLEGDWQKQDASIENLSEGEEVRRTVSVTPPEDIEPGRYTVPVASNSERGRADYDFFYLDVKKATFKPELTILEAPSTIELRKGVRQNIPLLVKNTGRKPLDNITLEVQNLESCGTVETTGEQSLDVNESGSVSLRINTTGSAANCNATLMVSSSQGATAFSSLETRISSRQALIPQRKQPPFIALLWTGLLAAYAVIKKNYGLDSSFVNGSFLLLIVGEAGLLVFLAVGHYGLVSAPFLPF